MNESPDLPTEGLGLDEEGREALREAFRDVGLHKLLTVTPVQLRPEPVIFEMPVAEEAFNPSGNLHGGAIATLIDVSAGTAAAMGSTAFEPGINTLVTADMHVRYLGRARGDAIRAESRVVRAGRQLTVVECQVLDSEHGKLIASADFAAMVVPLRGPLRPTAGDSSQPDY